MFGIFKKSEVKSGLKMAFWAAFGVVVMVPFVTKGWSFVTSKLGINA